MKDRTIESKAAENNYTINSIWQLPDQNFGVLEFDAVKVDMYIATFWNNWTLEYLDLSLSEECYRLMWGQAKLIEIWFL